MPRDERADLIVLLRRIAHDRAQRRHVVGLEAPAERVGHQVLGERHQERVLVLQQRAAQARRAFHLRAVVQLRPSNRPARRCP